MTKTKHKHFKHLTKKKKRDLLDKIVYVAAFAYPLTGLPQAIVVFQGSSEGVSLLSWIGFIFFSALFLAYGIVHKVKPMIITNTLWILVDLLVVISTIYQRM